MWLKKQIDKFKGVQKMARLPLNADLDQLVKCSDTLKSYVGAADNWVFPLDFSLERKQFLQRVKEYELAVANVNRHRTAIEQVADKARLDKQEMVRNWRGNRDRVRVWLENKGVSPVLAKLMGDALYSRVADPESCGVKIAITTPVVDLAAGKCSEGTFLQPVYVGYDAQKLEQDMNHFEKQLSTIAIISKQQLPGCPSANRK